MDISKTIGVNLGSWMAKNPDLNTLKKVAKESKVGFGTVQRAKNGDGNITVEKLMAIAAAFKRHPIELLIPGREQPSLKENGDYTLVIEGECQQAQEGVAKAAPVVALPSGLLQELMAIAEKINDTGLSKLIGYAQRLAEEQPREHKGNVAR